MIKYMIEHASQRYIYVVMYLEEGNRIQKNCPGLNFKQPERLLFGGKQADFHDLISRGENVCLTHELFSKLYLTDRELDVIGEYGYTLIFDEIPKVIEPLNICEKDRVEVLDRYIKVRPDNTAVWSNKDYPAAGNHGWIKQEMTSKAVILFEETQLLWILPSRTLRAFKDIVVMTFLFEGSYLKNYLDINGMPYNISHIENGELVHSRQDLTGHLKSLRPLVHIFDGELNEIGEKYTLSSTWWKSPKNTPARKKVGNTTYNYLWNKCRSKAGEAMWTSYKLKNGEEMR